MPFGRWEILKETIEEMRDNPDRVYQRGKNGRLLAEKKHNWSYNAQRLKALYKNKIQKYEYYY